MPVFPPVNPPRACPSRDQAQGSGDTSKPMTRGARIAPGQGAGQHQSPALAAGQLAGPVLPKAHTRFYLPWTWNGEEAVLQSRCLDEKGQLQPTEAEYARYWNLTRGPLYGTIQSQLGHCNWLQPWKVGPDGKVTNGLAPTDVVVDVHG